jgi:hypothetical protein
MGPVAALLALGTPVAIVAWLATAPAAPAQAFGLEPRPNGAYLVQAQWTSCEDPRDGACCQTCCETPPRAWIHVAGHEVWVTVDRLPWPDVVIARTGDEWARLGAALAPIHADPVFEDRTDIRIVPEPGAVHRDLVRALEAAAAAGFTDQRFRLGEKPARSR